MTQLDKDPSSINEKELMEYFGYKGTLGRIQLRARMIRSLFLHKLAYSSLLSGFTIEMQKTRGVKIGQHCHFCPYVQIDLVYPELVEIGNNVTIGSNVMIFAHVNPTANPFLKNGPYPRKVEKVIIKNGAVLNPGCIITAGITIGENSIVSVGSVVYENVPDYCVVVGNPARVVKKIDK
jgi:acetyltransferase-like isoleucine patch superfamily enzyme